jgi:thiamine kinase-like enzyme
MELIHHYRELSLDWLSRALSGRFPDVAENLAGFSVRTQYPTLTSEIAIIDLKKKTTATEIPDSVFIKISKETDIINLQGLGSREVSFYQKTASILDPSLVLNCYLALYDEKEDAYNLLFEDLSETHHSGAEWPIPPDIGTCRKVVASLGGIHAAWWDNPGLENMFAPYPTKEACLENFKRDFIQACNDFAMFLDDRLTEQYRSYYQLWMDHYESWVGRFLSFRNITLLHCDTHFWNFLLPKDQAGDIKLIDWQCYEYGIGAQDLAYMIALHWYPSRRKLYEAELLKVYHEALIRGGVKDYSLEELQWDYRWAVIGGLSVPVLQQRAKIRADVWWNHLERIMMAFEDLNCMELLK